MLLLGEKSPFDPTQTFASALDSTRFWHLVEIDFWEIVLFGAESGRR
jgi:hypothetical protein